MINKDAIHFDVKKESGCFTIINEVLSHPENNRFYAETNFNNVHEFYRIHMSNPKSPYFVDNSCLMPKPQEIVDLIHKVGGLAFIPHVYIYGENSQKVFETLTKDHLVDGIECYYSKFSNEQIEFLLEFCKQNKYFISGGSDYHGANKPEIHMGTGIQNNLRIPHDIVEKWAEFI